MPKTYLLNLSRWGPAGWSFIHAVTFTFPVDISPGDKEQYVKFFDTIPYILPCLTCRKHLKENYEESPIDFSSRRTLSECFVNIHNQVNKSKGKPIWTYLDVVRLYAPPSMYDSLDLTDTEREYLFKLNQDEEDALNPSNNKRNYMIWTVVAGGLWVVIICLFISLVVKYFKRKNSAIVSNVSV